MRAVKPKPRFRSFSEDDILWALDDPGNPLEAEVTRLVAAYTETFRRFGFSPDDILCLETRWPIEQVAMQLTADAIAQSRGEEDRWW